MYIASLEEHVASSGTHLYEAYKDIAGRCVAPNSNPEAGATGIALGTTDIVHRSFNVWVESISFRLQTSDSLHVF